MLRLPAVGVNGEGPQPTWQQQPVSSFSTVQRMAAAIWSGGKDRVGEHVAADDRQAGDKRQPAEGGRRPPAGPALRV